MTPEMQRLAILIAVVVVVGLAWVVSAWPERRAHAAPWWSRRHRRPAPVDADPEPVTYASFRDDATVTTPIGTLRLGWRYCPAEYRTVAVILHPDGSATCDTDGCGHHIPADAEEANHA